MNEFGWILAVLLVWSVVVNTVIRSSEQSLFLRFLPFVFVFLFLLAFIALLFVEHPTATLFAPPGFPLIIAISLIALAIYMVRKCEGRFETSKSIEDAIQASA